MRILMLTQEEKNFITESVHHYAQELMLAGYTVLPILDVRFSNSVRTFGCCKKHFDDVRKRFRGATITISESCLHGTRDCLKSVILHELIHAMPDTKHHDAVWQKYAREISKKFGVDIHTHVEDEDAEAVIENCPERFNWHVRCNLCGKEWHFVRKTKFVKNALRHGKTIYHKCGGNSFSVFQPDTARPLPLFSEKAAAESVPNTGSEKSAGKARNCGHVEQISLFD